MNERRAIVNRAGYFGFSLLLLAVAMAPVALAAERIPGGALIELLGVGPHVVDDGFVVGGDQHACDCDTDQDGVACPGGGTCGNNTYHGCPVVNNGAKHYCVGSGNFSYCGQGSCPVIQYATCVGTCPNSP